MKGGEILRLIDMLEVEDDEERLRRAEKGGRHSRGKKNFNSPFPDMEWQDELLPEYPCRAIACAYGAGDDSDPGRLPEYPFAFPVHEDEVFVVPVEPRKVRNEVPDVGFRSADLARQKIERVDADFQGLPSKPCAGVKNTCT